MPDEPTISELLDKLEKVGVNVAEFKMMTEGFTEVQLGVLRTQLMKMLQSRQENR